MLPVNFYQQNYEYTLDVINDKSSGAADVDAIMLSLDRHSKKGWRLVTIFTNEVGKNSISVGGIGINSTMDQSFLVYERKIEKIEPNETIVNFDVLESNMIEPFIPRSLTIRISDASISSSLTVFCKKEFDIKGLQCDLIVYNLFGDSVTLPDICFFTFKKDNTYQYTSDSFPISLPDRISHGVSHAGIIVKRYIGNDELILINDTTLLTIKDTISEKSSGFDKYIFMAEANSQKKAQDIYDLMMKANSEKPGLFTNDILAEMEKILRVERAYGIAKNDAIKELNKYFFS